MKKQLEAPDDEFTKLVGRQIHDGMLTKAVVEQLRPAIQAALDEVIRDRIQDKLNVAFRPESPASASDPSTAKADAIGAPQPDVVTTEDELQAFMIVRAIAASAIDLERVTIRDSKSYCSIFVDDNNRKPVCRLYFNAKNARHIGLFDAEKKEQKVQIESLVDIYKHAEQIRAAVEHYE